MGKAPLACLETNVKSEVSFTRQPCGWKDSVGSPGSGAHTAWHWSLQSCPGRESCKGAVPVHRVHGKRLARGSSGLGASRV